jgi:hypothetical protein
MSTDAAGSSWFDMGGPDFAQPSSLYNPATDTGERHKCRDGSVVHGMKLLYIIAAVHERHTVFDRIWQGFYLDSICRVFLTQFLDVQTPLPWITRTIMPGPELGQASTVGTTWNSVYIRACTTKMLAYTHAHPHT